MPDADGRPGAGPPADVAEAWRIHRLAQKRRWANLPLVDLVAALQEMAETAEWLGRKPSEVREGATDEG